MIILIIVIFIKKNTSFSDATGQITEEESLFTYPVGTSYDDYKHPDHIAPLIDDVVNNAPQNIVDMCNSNERCIFDAVQTENIELGTGTLSTIESNNMDVVEASMF